MDLHRAGLNKKGNMAPIALISASVLAVMSGCVATNPFVRTPDSSSPPVCQAVAIWTPRVVFPPDPANNGKPSPGIAGRLYLFGPQIGTPLVGDGSIVVDLYQETVSPNGKEPVMLEQWRMDRDTLKKLLKKDMIGWGYTVFLPWGTYRPDISHVRITVRYEPSRGNPIYAEPSSMNLEDGANGVPGSGHVTGAQGKASNSGPVVSAKPQ